MKVSFSLKEEHRLILRILGVAGKVQCPVLERILDVLDVAESDFEGFVKSLVKTVAAKRSFDLYSSFGKPKMSHLEQTLEGLILKGDVRAERA